MIVTPPRTKSTSVLLRRLLFFVFIANYIFHASGGVIWNLEATRFYPYLPITDFVDYLKSSQRYSTLVPAFLEFLLVIYLQVAFVAVMLVFLAVRRLVKLRSGKVVESFGLYAAVLVFFLLLLRPYVFPASGGVEAEWFLNISLQFQMLVQAALWAALTIVTLLCAFEPEQTFNIGKQILKRSN